MGAGLSPGRIAHLVTAAVRRLRLDLSGLRVVTEAATGAYVVTPLLAAAAGAFVTALTRDSRYGTASQARGETSRVAEALGVAGRIHVVEGLDARDLATADVVTNSGHVRPIDVAMIERMKATAVIPLMYESWELRHTDVDVAACRRRNLRVAGTNERHPEVAVFEYLGLVVLKAMLDAGHDPVGERCLLVCDNDFAPYVASTLRANGADVTTVADADEAGPGQWDTVVVARTPPAAGGSVPRLGGLQADLLCQLWGDVHRAEVAGTWSPRQEPMAGHMGLTLQSVGPRPIVKLQAAGLKVAEVMLRGASGSYADLPQWVVGGPQAEAASR